MCGHFSTQVMMTTIATTVMLHPLPIEDLAHHRSRAKSWTQKSVMQARSVVNRKDTRITDRQKSESTEAFFDNANDFKDPSAKPSKHIPL